MNKIEIETNFLDFNYIFLVSYDNEEEIPFKTLEGICSHYPFLKPNHVGFLSLHYQGYDIKKQLIEEGIDTHFNKLKIKKVVDKENYHVSKHTADIPVRSKVEALATLRELIDRYEKNYDIEEVLELPQGVEWEYRFIHKSDSIKKILLESPNISTMQTLLIVRYYENTYEKTTS